MFKSLFGNKEAKLVLARAKAELDLSTQLHVSTWGMGSAKRWDADLEAGTITFINAEDWVITAPVQVAGTFNSRDGSWLWGWDHPSVQPALARDAELARAFGEKHGLKDYTTRKITCSEAKAWEMTAVACHLAGSQGVYRGPSGDTYVFMTFGAVTISKPDAA